ncbi:membrane protein insertase YidC [Leuconostocaceae bacterium ESL0723]|nr:membrane protein insertase YidC [Leuconostocaceae bacterium ESL0723]
MQLVKKWIKTMGWVPIILGIAALIVIVVAGYSYQGHVAGSGLWDVFVAGFTRSLLGVSGWFGNNYGLGIIVFTILVRFVILPLMAYQTDSMMKMQALQPLIKELQAKYPGKDMESRQLLMNEQRDLYREHGVKTYATFLPVLLQMPILIALYQGILKSPELRAGDFLWVSLSRPDSYFILPILAAVFTFTSSWLGMQAQPEQTTITKVMPYIFPVVIFFTGSATPSALALYWVVGSAFQTVQTLYLQNPFKLRRERAEAKAQAKKVERKIRKVRRGRKRR